MFIAKTSYAERAACLRKYGELLAANADKLAEALSKEQVRFCSFPPHFLCSTLLSPLHFLNFLTVCSLSLKLLLIFFLLFSGQAARHGEDGSARYCRRLRARRDRG